MGRSGPGCESSQGRGWEHNAHGDLFRVVRLLAEDPANTGLTRLFGRASTLHVNFYENWLTSTDVRAELDDVVRFVALMAEVD